MQDLISRQAATDAICTEGTRLERNGTVAMAEIKQWCVDILDALPSAQPEIIQCKDCRHGVDYYHEGDCYCSNPKWGLKYFGGSWEFYCADSERRTDD